MVARITRDEGAVGSARDDRGYGAGTAMRDTGTEFERRRDRWNTLAILIPGQWFSLMAIFWGRFFPPLRPFGFKAAPPPAMGVAICCAVSCLPFLLPRGYFRPRSFERGRFYPRLGLRLFRHVAPDGDFINGRLRRADPSYRVVRNRAALREHIAGTYSNERWHLAFFLAGSFTAVFAARIGEPVFAALIAILNVAFNLYPVMHQRYKRARLRRPADTAAGEGRRGDASGAEGSSGRRAREGRGHPESQARRGTSILESGRIGARSWSWL